MGFLENLFAENLLLEEIESMQVKAIDALVFSFFISPGTTVRLSSDTSDAAGFSNLLTFD